MIDTELALRALLTLGVVLICGLGLITVLFVVDWLVDPFSGQSPLEHLNEGDQYDDD